MPKKICLKEEKAGWIQFIETLYLHAPKECQAPSYRIISEYFGAPVTRHEYCHRARGGNFPENSMKLFLAGQLNDAKGINAIAEKMKTGPGS